ncbi:MAG: cupin domain-containing protein [Nitrospirales bacterium]
MTAEDITRRLNLRPLPIEGGFYAETYRSPDRIPKEALPGRYGGAKSFGTAIYYLLTPETFSALHRLPSDEIYHFYLGDPVEMLQLRPDGSGEMVTLGTDLAAGMRPQVPAPRDVWQGSRLRPGGRFALLGTTMAPGFDFEDYEGASRDRLLRDCPNFADWIRALAR